MLPHFPILLAAVSPWYGAYLLYSRHSIFAGKKCLTTSFPQPHHHVGQLGKATQTCANRRLVSRCVPAPSVPSDLSLAQSAILPFPSHPPPLSMASQRENKKGIFVGNSHQLVSLPSYNYPILIHNPSVFSGMNPSSHRTLKNTFTLILYLVFPHFC